MVALVLAAVLMHGLLLPADDLSDADDQLKVVLGWGEVLGALFAALLARCRSPASSASAPSGRRCS
jgi:hypothetical protein